MASNANREIDGLLERYFEGLTTLEEERALRDYFAGGGVRPGAEYAGAMFAYFDGEAEGGRDSHDEVEVDAALREDVGIPRPAARGRNHWPRRRWVASSAVAAVAGIAIALAAHREPATVYCYVDGRPVTDYSEASRYTGYALRLVSESFAESVGQVERLGGVVDIFVASDAPECGGSADSASGGH